MMNEVYILDLADDVMMVAKFKEDHLVLMAKRGWIKQNQWVVKDRTVNTMAVNLLEEFLKEAA